MGVSDALGDEASWPVADSSPERGCWWDALLAWTLSPCRTRGLFGELWLELAAIAAEASNGNGSDGGECGAGPDTVCDARRGEAAGFGPASAPASSGFAVGVAVAAACIRSDRFRAADGATNGLAAASAGGWKADVLAIEDAMDGDVGATGVEMDSSITRAECPEAGSGVGLISDVSGTDATGATTGTAAAVDAASPLLAGGFSFGCETGTTAVPGAASAGFGSDATCAINSARAAGGFFVDGIGDLSAAFFGEDVALLSSSLSPSKMMPNRSRAVNPPRAGW